MEEQLIRNVPLFETLPQEEIDHLAATLPRRNFPQGRLLMREGTCGDLFYVLLEGQVEIIKALGTPAQLSLGLRPAGIFLGEMSLFNRNGVHTASVVAHTPLYTLEMTRVDFDALLTRHPTLAYTMTRLLSQRLEEADNRTVQDLLEKNRQLLQAYDATIEGWSRAMSLRDNETEGHLERVKDITIHLARAVGMSSDQVLQVQRGALLHDMGKLGVPDHILRKHGKLSSREWAIMRRHPQYAYDMLHSIDYLRPALDIPYCHHEKWDGSGYPRGLHGEQIPMAARLFSIVDVWDALCSDRPYRTGWPEERVIDYILSQSGTHFEPGAVRLFVQVMGEKETAGSN